MFVLSYLLAFIIIVYSMLVLLACIGWLGYKIFDYNKKPASNLMVSVIVSARNEEQYIGECLTRLLKQDYSQRHYEIIVINDSSTDSTKEVVMHYQQMFDNMILLDAENMDPELSNKKVAIELAISKAQGDLIVMTDADCKVPETWLSCLVSFYLESNTKMIIGPVCIESDGNLLGFFQTVEFAGIQMLTAVAARFKIPIMCNGANMAFAKDVFLEVGGYDGVRHLASGDDVHLMEKINRRYPGEIYYLRSKKALVKTTPANSMKELFYQRLRWASKTDFSLNRISFLTALLVFLFNLSGLILLADIFFIGKLENYCYYFMGIAIGINFLLLILGLTFIGKLKYFWLILPEQVMYFFYAVFMGAISRIEKGYIWKGRKVYK